MSKLRPLIFTALFAALTAAGAMIRIPLPPSAFTLQFLCAAMSGVLLGPVYGPLSQLVYLALGLLGLPVFASGGGFTYVLQPTFGFLLGAVAASWLIGRLCRGNSSPLRIALACLAGLAALYTVGVPYMALLCRLYLQQTWTMGRLLAAAVLPFLPADMLKILVCVLLAPRLSAYLGKIH